MYRYFLPRRIWEKRSAHIDLKTDTGRGKLRELIGEADVFSQGYRTGALERQGFGVAEVVRAKPGIVYVSINCYGHEGPWRSVPGWEQLAQTVTGWRICTASPTTMADLSCSLPRY
ncbi:MAG: hypothetical protein CM1200mP9_05600 [Gammaproteobacteria bacterium]|nr:MAG: hypothetical protein CM1200mP9_05600 [Gammaproteobacteria bacterium]